MTTKLAGTLIGAAIALAAGAAFAGPSGIYTMSVHRGDNAGRAYPYEDADRYNYDQVGAGIEHLRCNYLANADGGPRVMCAGTASYTDIPGSPVTDRIQVLCSSFKVDPVMGLQQTALKYITANNGRDWRNGHSPIVMPALNGKVAAIAYNYRPQNSNNTQFYGKVIGPNCEELTDQTLLFARDNDDVLGMANNGIVLADAADNSRLGVCGIGNGNGQDDGWCLGLQVTNTGGTYAISRYFAKSVVANEERSRMTVMPLSTPDRLMYCAAEGNSQPPDRGVRCGVIDTNPNTPNDNRILFRKYIQERQGDIYVASPAVAPIMNADGSPSDNFVVTYVEVDASDRHGRSKGQTAIKTLAVHISDSDVELIETPKYDMVGQGDQAHQAACGGFYGPDAKPVAFEIEGALSGSVTGVGRTAVIGYDSTLRKSTTLDSIVFADSQDSGWLSQYYGENPNTPQGRNHAFCMMLDNPGYAMTGGFESDVKKFLLVANTSRNLRADGSPEDKLAFDLVLVPAVVPQGTNPDPQPDPNPDPGTDPDPTPTPDDSGAQVGGCSTSGSSSGGTLLLLGAAVAITIVRRKRAE
jgi:hypothetical protein